MRARRTGYRSQRVRVTQLKTTRQGSQTKGMIETRRTRPLPGVPHSNKSTQLCSQTKLQNQQHALQGAHGPYLEYHTPTRAHSSVCKQICKTRSTALPGAHGPYLECHTPTRASSSVGKEHRAPTRARGSSQRKDAWFTLSSIFQCSVRLINPARWACWVAAQQAHLPSPGLWSEHLGSKNADRCIHKLHFLAGQAPHPLNT